MAPHSRHTVRIDIFSDIICPWCFIGLKRLEQAVELHGHVELDIRWRAYLLNPAMPPQGMDRQAYIDAKFGSAGVGFYNRIAAVGKESGIHFNFDAITRTPDSRPAQAVLKSAKGQATALKQAFFDAYFIAGQDLGDASILANLATQYSTPYPPSNDAVSAVEHDLNEAKQLGIQGVPYFIIDDEWAISGAQAPTSFQPLFDAALAKQAR